MTDLSIPAGQVEVTPLAALELVCGDIYARWDADQRSGKLLSALSGMMSPGYDPRVDLIRSTLASTPDTRSADVPVGDDTAASWLYEACFPRAGGWSRCSPENKDAWRERAYIVARLSALSPTHTVSDMGVGTTPSAPEVAGAVARLQRHADDYRPDEGRQPLLLSSREAEAVCVALHRATALTADKPEDMQGLREAIARTATLMVAVERLAGIIAYETPDDLTPTEVDDQRYRAAKPIFAALGMTIGGGDGPDDPIGYGFDWQSPFDEHEAAARSLLNKGNDDGK